MEDLLTLICWVILTPIVIISFCTILVIGLPVIFIMLSLYVIKDRHERTDIR